MTDDTARFEPDAPPPGSSEHGAQFRQRILDALRDEAEAQHLFDRQHGQMGREHILGRLATAVIAVAYPELFARRNP